MSIETGWMSDVLNDLQSFCIMNGLDTAAKKLEETNKFVREELGHGCCMELMRLEEPEDTSRL